MKLTQIRNATLLLDYAGKTFLIDPFLAPRGAYPGLEGTLNAHLRNPLVDLPVDVDSLLHTDAVLVTHTHPDHWDEAAQRLLPKDTPIFAQHEQDAALIRAAGFRQVRVLQAQTAYDGITLHKTAGQHGSDLAYANAQLATILGEVCGIVFSHPAEPSVYLAGDTVWHRHVDEALHAFAPDVIILNAGDAQIPGIGNIIMGKEDLLRAHRAMPNATIVATHLEAVNHCVLSRETLRQFIAEQALSPWVRVPEDGESYYL
ncbi:MBL fold metallo-hydrolase [Serratia marcescens]|uniref:MBL fold metallo-hydrolase n=1 Tax=Serratia marcescens TaxID=615 RepID=UPI001561A547|nr:MBL fold metallo-hydrolase [Serratia marcescens]NRN12610.1 MBL fold metallo-hydrolase [Serratia marcescens]NRN36348.1 MBL fold metallo-hydrolase [Serratia marcescens]